ncbi:MAG: ABC-2 transporter permease [Eggerthellales bacterium]|nr:ABC-2 transporter permease [Eggerthellales bacterium]
MKSAFMIDFQVCRSMLRQQFVSAIIIALVIALPLGNLYAIVPTVTLAVAVSAGFSVMALDEQNSWEAFRAALPVTRRGIMFGRALFIATVTLAAMLVGVVASAVVSQAFPLIDATWGQIMEMDPEGYVFEAAPMVLSCGFSLVILGTVMCVTLPLVAKYGMTKAIRFIPLAMCAVGVTVACVVGSMSVFSGLTSALAEWFAASPVPVGLFLAVAAVCLFAVGAVLASRLYQRREF